MILDAEIFRNRKIDLAVERVRVPSDNKEAIREL